MWSSLHSFYCSDEWRNFRLQHIAAHINPADGILYSEHSGKPIVKAYDIILHHKTELTLQNVNDYNISLNPDNILICSMKEHNEIHERWGTSAQRKVYYVYGAPCSGKTTYVHDSKGANDIVCDIDNIWQCITGGDRYIKPNTLKSNVFIMRDCMLDMIKTRAGKWHNAYIIEGGALQAERERRINALGAEPIYVEATKEECLQRLATDSNRQHVKSEWREYIEKYFAEYQPA